MTLVSMQIAASGITTMDNKTLTINLVGGGTITLIFQDTQSLSSMAEMIVQVIADVEEDGLDPIVDEEEEESLDDELNEGIERAHQTGKKHDERLAGRLDNLTVANESFDYEEETQQLFFLSRIRYSATAIEVSLLCPAG